MKKNNLTEGLTYLLFGVLTTAVNILIFIVATEWINIHYLIANVSAWIGSVAFAFVTNKLWVFQSPSWKMQLVRKEALRFVTARLASGAMDMLLMWGMVDTGLFEELWAKIIVNVLVVVANYVASKLWIFRKST